MELSVKKEGNGQMKLRTIFEKMTHVVQSIKFPLWVPPPPSPTVCYLFFMNKI